MMSVDTFFIEKFHSGFLLGLTTGSVCCGKEETFTDNWVFFKDHEQ